MPQVIEIPPRLLEAALIHQDDEGFGGRMVGCFDARNSRPRWPADDEAMTRPGPLRFDPIVLGNHECDAWAAYYRHAWLRLLRASVGMVRVGFGMSTRKTLTGAWLVLRANQA